MVGRASETNGDITGAALFAYVHHFCFRQHQRLYCLHDLKSVTDGEFSLASPQHRLEQCGLIACCLHD